MLYLTTDYNSVSIIGSPYVFGGVHAPTSGHYFMWDKLSDVGVTLLRSDFFLEFCAPKNITLDEYRNNRNNIQDTNNWPKQCLANISEIYRLAKKNDMKVAAVVAYTPPWLTKSGNSRDLPVDWEVYEEIVSKLYKLNRPNIDLIEVWNEPDHTKFFQISPGASKESAYLDLYFHVAKAIKKVDDDANDGKRALIGGPAISCPCNSSYIEKMLGDSRINESIDFVSIHSYEDGDKYLPAIKEILAKYDAEHLPIYVSEWNKGSTAKTDREYNQTYKSVTYTATRLLNFLNNNVQLASYFSLRQNDPANALEERQAYGFYRMNGKKYNVFPQQYVWQLLSKVSSLGSGNSKIFEVSGSESLPTLSFINADGEPGVIVVNDGSDISVNLTTLNLPIIDRETSVHISRITEAEGIVKEYCTERIIPKNVTNFSFAVPANSVIAIRFEPFKHSLADVARILAISTQKDCIVYESQQ
jgi:hypothetical protein